MNPGKNAQSGFTLIEIMIVVAIIALLAAVAIPNVLRGRTSANEASAIGNLRALVSSAEMYRSVNNHYPSAWQTDMYGTDCTVGTAPDPDYGPPSFCLDIQTSAATVQGFNYLYAPAPAGCDNSAGNECSSYSITAAATTLGRTGTRGFYASEAGTIRHCTAAAQGDVASATSNTLDQTPAAC